MLLCKARLQDEIRLIEYDMLLYDTGMQNVSLDISSGQSTWSFSPLAMHPSHQCDPSCQCISERRGPNNDCQQEQCSE